VTSQGRATVLVVDDDPAFRESLEEFLRSAGYFAKTFASAREFQAHVPDEMPTCVLVDLRMPGMTGLQLQQALERAGYRYSMVFLTGHGDVKATAEAMKHGAVDCLEKPYDEARLLSAIERALALDAVANGRDAVRSEVCARLARLTPAERQVCDLLASGLRNKEIAARLGKTESTVEAERAAVMAKLRVASLGDIARLVDLANETR